VDSGPFKMYCEESAAYVEELFKLKDRLLDLAGQISEKYPASSKIRVVNLLLKHVCERCIIELLSSPAYSNREDMFDKVWRNLHSYAVTLFLERLKNELTSRKIAVAVVSEGECPTGRYDVLVTNGRTIQILHDALGKHISVEFKTSLNVDFTQLEKYLWNNISLILVRVETGHVVTLRTDEWREFLKFSLKDRIDKAERILDGKMLLVPGKDCFECPLNTCRFNKHDPKKEGFTKLENLTRLLGNFKENLYPAIDNAVKAVLAEIDCRTTSRGEYFLSNSAEVKDADQQKRV